MKAQFLLVEFPIKTLILTLNPTELKDIRSYWTEPRVQSLIPWMSRPLTWMSMVWTCLNSLMVSILWSIPWSIHPPAMPRAMTSIDTPRRLVFWPHLSAIFALKTSTFSKPKQLMLGSDRDLLGGDYFACLPCNGFLAFGPYNVHAGSMREAYGSWEGTPLAASSFQVCGNQHFDNRPFMIRKVQQMISASCHDTKLLSMWLISETWRNMSFHPRSSSKDVPIKKYILKKKNVQTQNIILYNI